MSEPAEQVPAVEPAPVVLPSPGALLRQARERAGLGAEDLAGQLKLAKGTLEALERDDFAALSEPVYIRGYYRKIAKVLPIAEAELIGAYNARTNTRAPAAMPIRRLPLAGGVAAGTSRHAQGPGVGVIVAIIVGIGVLIAVATRQPVQRLLPPATAPAPAPAAPAAPQPEAAAAQPDAAAPQAAPAAGSTAQTPAAAPAAPAAAPNQLVLEFSEASFVRVEDSRAKTLAIGLVRGGERHALDGAPPYTVFLGNAQNVKVFYGGAPVDFAAHVNRQNDTARFTVP
jgi:cytoskeleton protein RodZ